MFYTSKIVTLFPSNVLSFDSFVPKRGLRGTTRQKPSVGWAFPKTFISFLNRFKDPTYYLLLLHTLFLFNSKKYYVVKNSAWV